MSRLQHREPKQMPGAGAPATCRECTKPLTTPATTKRGMCRSCYRVQRALDRMTVGPPGDGEGGPPKESAAVEQKRFTTPPTHHTATSTETGTAPHSRGGDS